MRFRLNDVNDGFKVVDGDVEYVTGFEIVRLLNELDKKVKFQDRVIDKSIRFEKSQEFRIEELEKEKSVLKQEIGILRKIIGELQS